MDGRAGVERTPTHDRERFGVVVRLQGDGREEDVDVGGDGRVDADLTAAYDAGRLRERAFYEADSPLGRELRWVESEDVIVFVTSTDLDVGQLAAVAHTAYAER